MSGGQEARTGPAAPAPSRQTALMIGAAVAVGLVGAWSIAAARRGALDEATRAFAAEVATHARALEAGLAAVRADLAFLAASSPVPSRTPGAAADWSQGGVEGALLLFLRGHPEVVRVAVLSARGDSLFHAGRRGGVPLLWVATSPTGREGAALAPDRVRLLTRLAWHGGDAAPGGEPLVLETEVEPALLLRGDEHNSAWSCRLEDAGGRLLARQAPAGVAPSGASVDAAAPIGAEDWSVPAPWRLACAQPASAALARVESVSARYRSTLLLNLGAMGLAFALGGYARQQARRRQRLEARAREQVRVRELEHQLFHAERLGTVGRLAAGIAHELNNPLEGMSNWLSLARDALAQGEPQRAAEHLTRVKEGLDQAAGIVRQVLAHADPARAPQGGSVDLNQVLGHAALLVQSRAKFRGITFALELAREPQLVQASQVTLGQVAINLVLNACEAQPRGGEVSLSSRREGGSVVVEIADRGPGVAEADRARIFEPFFSTKNSTGLGLSVCHGIVRQLSGELSVRPREGGGAVFRLSLPAAPAGLREAS